MSISINCFFNETLGTGLSKTNCACCYMLEYIQRERNNRMFKDTDHTVADCPGLIYFDTIPGTGMPSEEGTLHI